MGCGERASAQYAAKCPAHDDQSPSLAVRDLGDRILIHCFAGCEPADIMSAVGLALADLFVRGEHHVPVHIRERWDARTLLRLLRTEAGVVLIAANAVADGRPLNPDDMQRLRTAVGRITRVAEVTQ